MVSGETMRDVLITIRLKDDINFASDAEVKRVALKTADTVIGKMQDLRLHVATMNVEVRGVEEDHRRELVSIPSTEFSYEQINRGLVDHPAERRR
jgi:exosome complex RNA-binding protein Csl4